MRIPILIFLYFNIAQFSGTMTFAQSPKIDSLLVLLDSSKEDSLLFKQHIAIAEAAKMADKALALKHGTLAKQLAKTNENKLWEAIAYLQLGQVFYWRDSYVKAISLTDTARMILNGNPDRKLLAEVESFQGGVYTFKGDYAKALYHLFEANDILKELNLEELLAKNRLRVAYLLDQRMEFEESIAFNKKALEYFERDSTKFSVELSGGYAQIGISLDNLGKYEEAIIFFHKALDIANQTKDEYGKLVCVTNLGWCKAKSNNPNQAIKYASEGLAIAQKYNDLFGIQYNSKSLGLAFSQIGENSKAEEYLLTAKALADSIPNLQEQLEVRKVLAEFYEELGTLNQRLALQKEYKFYSDSLLKRQNNQQIADLEIQFEVKEKEQENRLLKNDLLIQRLWNAILLGSLFIIILFLIIGWITLDKNRKANLLLEEKVEQRTGELKKTNQQLTQANMELKEFSYMTSHDLKEPIRNISGFASLAKRHVNQQDFQALNEDLTFISKGVEQLHQLIEDIFHFANIGTISVMLEQVALQEVLNDIQALLKKRIQENNGQLVYQELPIIESNKVYLRILFKNLIENGLKYNRSSVPTVTITYEDEGTFHRFLIQDNGIGISDEFKEKIFGMFKRLHDRKAYSGSGLGLSMCKKVVEKLGGEIGIQDSLVEKGTTFYIKLPK